MGSPHDPRSLWISLSKGEYHPRIGFRAHRGNVLPFAQGRGAVMHQVSRYFMNGSPTGCAFCGQQFDGHAWRGYQNKYYCNEFCSDEAEAHSTIEQRNRRAS